MTETGPSPLVRWREALLLLALALLVRLVLLPHATLDANDTAVRVWLGWDWADDPFLITNGIWGPLHFYLIGTFMKFWADPVWAPLVLHVAIGSLLPIIVYQLSLELFGSRRSALAAGLIFAFYPAAIAVSLGARVETPFMLFFGLGLIGLVRAWRPDGRLSHAVFAGFMVTLASMLRYEAWMLLPFLTLLLVHRPKLAAAFVATAIFHPVFWMIGNYLESGNPLYSIMATSTWVEDATAHAPDTQLVPGLGRVARLIGNTAVEMTLPAALLVAAGVILSLRRRRVESVWLLPALALFGMMAVFTFRDSMPVKMSYSTTFGLLLFPFVALPLERLGIERWSRTRCLAAAGMLFLAMSFFMFGPVIERLPGGRKVSANPVPTFPDESNARRLQSLLEESGLEPGQDALILDYIGSRTTVYVAWQTRLHPEMICRAPGAANWHVPPERIRDFLRAHHSGVLVTRPGGRITARLTLASANEGVLAGIPLRLQPIGSMDWESDIGARDFGLVTVSRYEVAGAHDIVPLDPSACHVSCPVTMCRHSATLQR